MESCLYEGWVRHRRFTPVEHRFQYRLGLIYLDLDELDDIFRDRWLWSTRRPAFAWFRRSDHLGDPQVPLKEAVSNLLVERGWPRPTGPIRLLTHLRYAGFVMNPVSFYYCFAADGSRVDTVIAEVNNTPWGEQHIYVLDADQFRGKRESRSLQTKEFHVSPFMSMDAAYRWSLTKPGNQLAIHIENWREDSCFFDVTMRLERRPLTGHQLARFLLRYPLMTAQVIAAIYWQAFHLWRKGCPFYAHPKVQQHGTTAA